MSQHENQPEGKVKEYTIIVNAREKIVTAKELSFDQVVALWDNRPTGPNILYNVTYRRAEGNKEGNLVEGGTVKIKDGMIFNVIATDKS